MTDREAFEAWARKEPRYPVKNPDFSRLGTSDSYSNEWVQADWEVWQAATAAERELCAKVCESGLNGGGRRGWNQAMNWCADAIRKGE